MTQPARMLLLSAALGFSLAAAPAQTIPNPAQTIPDPANLTGEHITAPAPADTLAIDHGAAALQQLLLKLNTRASLMLIVAHPDDEDGGMLTYESRGQGARVAMLTLTRGEGGQNLMSADFNDALGLIRTQELLAEDRYTGTDQMFGTEADFGFSKTREESLAKWTHARVLYDAVRAVRLYRPLVVASVFLGEPTDGHGHHQVAGEITQEVFAAAADPKVFPGMGLPPWAPLKLYVRVPFAPVTEKGMYDYATGKFLPPQFRNYYTGKVATSEPQANVQIHEGEPATINGKPALGMDGLSYVQFARRGLGLQKTQIGPGVRLAPPGRADSGYIRYGSRIPGQTNQGNDQESGFFAGINTSLAGIITLAPGADAVLRAQLTAALQAIDGDVAAALQAFDPGHLEAAAPPLAHALKVIDLLLPKLEGAGLPASQRFNLLHELRVKRVQMNAALALALNATLSADADSAPTHLGSWVVTGQPHMVRLRAHAAAPARLTSVTVSGPAGELARKAGELTSQAGELGRPQGKAGPAAGDSSFALAVHLPANTPLTRPYFSRPDIEQPFYTLSNPDLRNAPSTPAPVTATASFVYQGTLLSVISDVAAGSPRTALSIVPRVSVEVYPAIGIDSTAPGESRPLQLGVAVQPILPSEGRIELKLPPAWTSQPGGSLFAQSGPNTQQTSSFVLQPPTLVDARRYPVQAAAESGGHRYTEGLRPAGYPGVTPTNYYLPASYTAVAVNVRTAPGVKVAYLPGTGDDVPAYLPNLGVTPTLLTLADLTPASLARFNTVVLGVRAYAAHPGLAGAGSAPLLDFARKGGSVIVQYNTSIYGSSSAPAPITVPGDPGHNVVVEADPVVLIHPDAPLLTWPNRITPADFNGWVEERGHGFATSWAPAYTPLLQMHDPEQDPQQGGLLVANVGKGHYIYCALALYRQLPEGVPGAYRLMANLLSLSSNPAASK